MVQLLLVSVRFHRASRACLPSSWIKPRSHLGHSNPIVPLSRSPKCIPCVLGGLHGAQTVLAALTAFLVLPTWVFIRSFKMPLKWRHEEEQPLVPHIPSFLNRLEPDLDFLPPARFPTAGFSTPVILFHHHVLHQTANFSHSSL
uniref:Uncharacterized protein n=1 Tax=Fagus sylvatica TaxID=28930 RepID=A0A2N9IXN5_FAGSY